MVIHSTLEIKTRYQQFLNTWKDSLLGIAEEYLYSDWLKEKYK